MIKLKKREKRQFLKKIINPPAGSPTLFTLDYDLYKKSGKIAFLEIQLLKQIQQQKINPKRLAKLKESQTKASQPIAQQLREEESEQSRLKEWLQLTNKLVQFIYKYSELIVQIYFPALLTFIYLIKKYIFVKEQLIQAFRFKHLSLLRLISKISFSSSVFSLALPDSISTDIEVAKAKLEKIIQKSRQSNKEETQQVLDFLVYFSEQDWLKKQLIKQSNIVTSKKISWISDYMSEKVNAVFVLLYLQGQGQKPTLLHSASEQWISRIQSFIK